MKTDNSYAEDCRRAGNVLAIAGDRWMAPILSFLGTEPKRFKDIRDAVDGISDRMLSVSLRTLQEHGLVARTAYPTVPPRVDYVLTGHGLLLKEKLRPVGQFILDHIQVGSIMADNAAGRAPDRHLSERK